MDLLTFFLGQHAAVHASDVSGQVFPSQRIFSELDDHQMRVRPGPGLNSLAALARTHEDLMAEMKSGTRPSIGRAESDWATQYEQTLLPPDIRLPKVGEIYESVRDIDVQFEIYFAAPVTNSGTGRLRKGERVRITFREQADLGIRGSGAIPDRRETLRGKSTA